MCMEGCCMPMRCEHAQHPHFRRFFTKEEKIKELEKYMEELRSELKAVEELMNELKGK